MRYLWDKPIGEIKNTNKAQTVDDEKREELEKYVKELLYERTAGKKRTGTRVKSLVSVLFKTIQIISNISFAFLAILGFS